MKCIGVHYDKNAMLHRIGLTQLCYNVNDCIGNITLLVFNDLR